MRRRIARSHRRQQRGLCCQAKHRRMANLPYRWFHSQVALLRTRAQSLFGSSLCDCLCHNSRENQRFPGASILIADITNLKQGHEISARGPNNRIIYIGGKQHHAPAQPDPNSNKPASGGLPHLYR